MWLHGVSLQYIMHDWSIVLNGHAQKRDELMQNIREEFKNE